MNTKPFTSGLSENAVMITRVADRQWHALNDDLVVGRGYAEHRPDGRLFASALFEGIGARPVSSNLELVR